MSYASDNDLEFAAGGAARLVQLADWDNDGVADADRLTQAKAKADGFIDGYLRKRYTTPIASPTETLKRLAAAEAVYLLRLSRGMVTTDDKDEAKERIRQYEALGKGEIRPDEPLPQKSTAVRPSFRERDASGTGVSRNGLKGAW